MTIAKTWYGDDGVYICVRADIGNISLEPEIENEEHGYRLGIYDNDEHFKLIDSIVQNSK